MFKARIRCPAPARRAERGEAGTWRRRLFKTSGIFASRNQVCNDVFLEGPRSVSGDLRNDASGQPPGPLRNVRGGRHGAGGVSDANRVRARLPLMREPLHLEGGGCAESPRQSSRHGNPPTEIHPRANDFGVRNERAEAFENGPPEQIAFDAAADRAFPTLGRTRQMALYRLHCRRIR